MIYQKDIRHIIHIKNRYDFEKCMKPFVFKNKSGLMAQL